MDISSFFAGFICSLLFLFLLAFAFRGSHGIQIHVHMDVPPPPASLDPDVTKEMQDAIDKALEETKKREEVQNHFIEQINDIMTGGTPNGSR